MPKKPKGCISLSDAVERTAKKAFNGFDDPRQAARDWLYEEFCCHWQVPVLGFRKIPKGYWAAHRREALQTIQSGLFVPYDEGEDFRFPSEWLGLREELLFLDRAEFMARLSVLLGGPPLAIGSPMFEKHEEALAGHASAIEDRFTAVVSPEDIRQRFPTVPQAALEMAFSDPRIAAMNRYNRYSNAPTIEAQRWVDANPPKLPSERPRPAGMMDPIDVSLTVCETLTWIAIGEPMDWWGWIGAQTGLEPREVAVRDRRFGLAENELRAAIANELLTCRHATLGNVGIVPSEVFAVPGAQPSISFLDDKIRAGDYEWDRVFFRAVDLVACWPAIYDDKWASDDALATAIRDWFLTDRIPSVGSFIPTRDDCWQSAGTKFGRSERVRKIFREVRQQVKPEWSKTGPKGLYRKGREN